MRTRIARGAGVVLLSVLALTGCSAVEAEFGSGGETEPEQSEAPEQSGGGNFTDRKTNDVWVKESRVQLSDGRVVTCLKYDEFKQGGLSCDWDNATAPGAPSASDGGE